MPPHIIPRARWSTLPERHRLNYLTPSALRSYVPSQLCLPPLRRAFAKQQVVQYGSRGYGSPDGDFGWSKPPMQQKAKAFGKRGARTCRRLEKSIFFETLPPRTWRNWQTRRFQEPVPLREWRFDSSRPQSKG